MPSFSPSTIVADDADTTGPDTHADATVSEGGRIRLLVLTDTSILSSGGSERFLRNLMARLPPERYRVVVVQLTDTTRAWSDTSLPDGIQHVQLRSLPIAAVYGLRGWLALRSLRRLVERGQFDIIQSQHEKSDLLNAFLPRTKGSVRISNRRDMGFNKSARLRFLFRFLNHRFDCVVAPAQPILSGLAREEDMQARRMLWIPNGVDTERFQPQPLSARRQTRLALGLAEDAIAFGCIASLTPVKRHCDLIEAFAQVHRQCPQARLLLVGDGPLREPITAQIEALGLSEAVRLLGSLPNVEGVLPALDAAVLVSSTEGMSNAVLEAMACGLPVVATGVGGNLQLVQHGISGLLVPAHEPAALAAALQHLIDEPLMRERMGASARARILREFSLDSMVHAFDRLYHRLLGRP
ncbi:glycosyltransferase [Lysobacter cavernae]|uniref:Glycosyltransferase n=1 Tax=Lysobacter cavernae TaxID=1685901 RepID=A0ABV7RM41_9GAMM